MKEKLQDLSDRVTKLVEKAISDLESEPELGDREVRALETVNKIIAVLVEREKGRKQVDPMQSLGDDELLEILGENE